MGSNYNRCIRVAVLFLSSIVVYMQLVQHRATKGLTSLLIFLQISLFLVKVLIIKPIYTCFSEHVVTLAHLISIIHLHPPRCCFFFFLISFLLLQKHLLLHAHTHALHILRTHTSKTHRKPSAYAMQQRGQEQGVNSRESGRGVGGVWEDHMHFTRDWWKHMLTHLITHSIVTLRKR